jgi:L-ascorbate metabolism protein UlaG (beta-lactamase superfamily)
MFFVFIGNLLKLFEEEWTMIDWNNQNLRRMRYGFIFLIAILSLYSGVSHSEEVVIKIHYLGHSAFVLQFDNGINIVTDYGHYNAWADWGWDSPIHNFGDLIPDVMTYSHTNHEDHYDPDRIPEGVSHILTAHDSLVIEGIHIKPVRTCENNINTESNSSYIFTYKDLKICHLGDAQAQIINIENQDVCDHIVEIFPDTFDLLLMTIDGTQQFLEQTEIFVDVLKPRRVIPMHYWTEIYKSNVLQNFEDQNMPGKSYQVEEIDGPNYTLSSEEALTPIKVISLKRAPFSIETSVEEKTNIGHDYHLYQNHPNPFNPRTIINYELPITHYVNLSIYNSLGQKVVTLVSEVQAAGSYQVQWNASGFSSGVYYYILKTGDFRDIKRMILLR